MPQIQRNGTIIDVVDGNYHAWCLINDLTLEIDGGIREAMFLVYQFQNF